MVKASRQPGRPGEARDDVRAPCGALRGPLRMVFGLGGAFLFRRGGGAEVEELDVLGRGEGAFSGVG